MSTHQWFNSGRTQNHSRKRPFSRSLRSWALQGVVVSTALTFRPWERRRRRPQTPCKKLCLLLPVA